MTERRTREIMAAKKFSTNNAGHTIFYYFDGNTAVRQHNEQDFHVSVLHPIRGWEDTNVFFRNPVAAATYAVRHIIPKQQRYTGR